MSHTIKDHIILHIIITLGVAVIEKPPFHVMESHWFQTGQVESRNSVSCKPTVRIPSTSGQERNAEGIRPPRELQRVNCKRVTYQSDAYYWKVSLWISNTEDHLEYAKLSWVLILMSCRVKMLLQIALQFRVVYVLCTCYLLQTVPVRHLWRNCCSKWWRMLLNLKSTRRICEIPSLYSGRYVDDSLLDETTWHIPEDRHLQWASGMCTQCTHIYFLRDGTACWKTHLSSCIFQLWGIPVLQVHLMSESCFH